MNKGKHFENAEKFVEKGKIDRAIKELRKILKEDPAEEQARLTVGDLFTREGKLEEACQEYLIAAGICSESGATLKAIAIYKQILKLNESQPDIYFKLGDLYHHMGLQSEAMKTFQTAARMFRDKGLNDDCLSVLRRIVEVDSGNLAFRREMADLLASEGRHGEAREALTSLIKDTQNERDRLALQDRLASLDGADAGLLKQVARQYLDAGDPKRALGKLSKLFKANPQDLETLQMLAATFLLLKQTHKATTILHEVAKLHDRQGDLNQRDAVLRQILEHDAHDETAAALLESRQASVVDLDRTVPRLKINVDPKSQPVDLVAEAEKQALEAVPVGENTVSFEVIIAQVSKVESGVDSLQNAKAHFDLGRVYKEMGLYPEALVEYEAAMKGGKRKFECLTMLAIVLHLMGSDDRARQTLEEAGQLLGGN